MVVKPWNLERSARCHNCGDATIHDVTVDEYNLQIRCRECGFRRYYTFNMVEIPKK
jgi:DNA-directed RNA polymerase subunit RPC12/RpoP